MVEKSKRQVTIKWHDDLGAQAQVKALGLKGSWGWVALADIDVKTSRINMGRLSKEIDPQQVETYTLAMQGGASFPGLVLWGGITAGGNHREEAARKVGDSHVWALSIAGPVNEVTLRLLTIALNMSNGIGLKTAERIEMALRCIAEGMPEAMAAQTLLLSPKRLKDALRIERIRTKCREEGIELRGVPESTVDRLNPFLRDVPVLKAAAIAVKRCQLTSEQTAELLGQVKEQSDEAARLRVLTDYTQRHTKNSASARFIPRQSDLQKLSRTLKGLLTLLDQRGTIDGFGPFAGPGDREELRRTMRDASTKLWQASHSLVGEAG